MKAILVINMPDDMRIEDTNALSVTLFNGLFVREVKMICPLKPLPTEKKPDNPDETWGEMHERWGYNKCLDDILGEEKVKALILCEVPKKWLKDPSINITITHLNGGLSTIGKLKPLPEVRDETPNGIPDYEAHGWNMCLDEILGETE